MSAPRCGADGVPLAAEPFLTHLTVEKGRSALTLRAYRQDLRRYAGFLGDLGRELDEVTEGDVRAFLAGVRAEGLAPSSVIRLLGTVRSMHRFLAVEGLAPGDPTVHVEPPRRPAALPRGLSEAEVSDLLDAVDAAARRSSGVEVDDAVVLRDRALLELLYSSGMRVSEACGLGFGDLDVDAGFVRVLGKRSKERLVPVGRLAERAMGEYLDHARPRLIGTRPDRDAADAVFLGRRGRRMSRQAVWGSIRRWAAVGGVTSDVSPHVLRHSCATHMLDHGADIRTVQELLGHASVSTTQIYTRVATDRLMAAYREAHPRAAAVLAAPAARGQR